MSGAKKRVPKRRFKEFLNAGDWEQRKLGDIVDFLDGQRKPLKESDRIKGKYPYYGASGIIDYINDYLFDENLVLLSEDGANIIDRNYPICFIATGKYWVNNHAHVLKVKAGVIDKFICESLERLDYTKFNTGTAQPKLNQDICQKIVITIPNEDEQKCISEFLDRINNIITLHQRKLDKLQATKKALLQEMFPEEGQDKPKRRFKGFADAWEQRKLDEVCNVYDGTHQTPRYTNSGVMFISVEDIETLESNKYISEEDFKSEFKVFPEYGDILLTRIGDVGSANVILDEIKRAYYVSLALLKPKNINSLFLLALLGSSSVQSEIWRRTLHIAFPKKINKNEINKVIVKQPSIPEQEKIGKLFFSLDQTITLYQRKLDKLKNLKQAYLNEMFV